MYHLEGEVQSLYSERDQNFRVRAGDGREFVLKIANPAEDPAVLDFQTCALLHIAGIDASLPVPRVIRTADGSPSRWIVGPDGRRSIVRLLTFLPGRLLDHAYHTPGLLREIGTTTARLARALRGFFHPAARHDLLWDLLQAPRLRQHTRHIDDPGRRRLVERTLDDFEERVLPQLHRMRAQVIHNDVSCHNTLIDPIGGERVTGVIDFGDMIHAPLINDIAVPVAELMVDQPDRLGAAMEIVAGYHDVERFTEDEIRVVFDLAAARIAMSLSVAAWREKGHPENIEYITAGNRGFFETLEWLAARDMGFAHACLRHACGLPAVSNALAVNCWLQEHGSEAGPILDRDLAAARKRVITDAEDPANSETAQGAVGIATHGSETPCGGRPAPPSSWCEAEACTVHLGVDLYVPAGTPVSSPLDATVHGVFEGAGSANQDGAVVVLEHTPEAGVRFYSAYRPLKPTNLRPGSAVERGGRLGEVADGTSPHLHVQLAAALPADAPLPTCCEPSKQNVWRGLCPDPNALLRIPKETFEPPGETVEHLLERRARLLGPALELFYDHPVHVVRGCGARLIDASGRAYIDAYNNVPQVGHSHPAVVEALTRQAATLNTNTRYLFASVLDYAERLTATLHDGLSVCMFVNSGSEANDLAWRLAKAHTGNDGAIVLRDAYHGITDAVFHLSPSEIKDDAQIAPHVATIPAPDDYRGPHRRGEPNLGERYAAYVDEAVEKLRRRGHRLAAFYIDPGMMSSGVIEAPAGYLPAVFARVRSAGGLCVADEVQSGFGRMGTHLWGFEALDAEPDIVTFGKPIGNGHPLAALATRPEILRSLTQRSDVFSTFGGNPVACAVGLAVLDVLEREGLRESALRVGARLRAGLEALAARYELIGDVRGSGLIVGVELVRDRASLEPAAREAHAVVNQMREDGVLVGLSGVHRNILKIRPPLAFSETDAERLIEALARALDAQA
ncbi:MAG TPA: aminotransferase class III-fold pyridoxal phosphate-dependent enzyme [Myxococcota bacterium]